ncbi:callose synthase 7-like [Planoprotostelium fungivorum]|uniref:Callose synthase 7-like n=1 Tax=Planoprotostelium fungivorum TaxID=1890364 RepID=A0A2P6NJ87_9EUKA|nr:callose synthase 7-like [Planoprotostelium fungivorum]
MGGGQQSSLEEGRRCLKNQQVPGAMVGIKGTLSFRSNSRKVPQNLALFPASRPKHHTRRTLLLSLEGRRHYGNASSWGKAAFLRHIEVLRSVFDSHWIGQQLFQQHIVEIAWHKLKKRAIGWLMHRNVWTDEEENESKFRDAWEQFEKKHFRAYKRWKKITGAAGGFDLKMESSLEQGINNIFLYYLVYAEVQDLRCMQNLTHLFFHIASALYNDKNSAIKAAEWIRREGTKVYRFMSLVYSKDDMNQDVFHHDDMDDLSATNAFVKVAMSTLDLYKALKIEKYPTLAKVLQLDTPTFIVYWLKGAQGELNGNVEKAQQREKWIIDNFTNARESQKIQDHLNKAEQISSQTRQLNAEMKACQEALSTVDRYRPKEEDFDEKPDSLAIFQLALTQLDTARELFLSAEETERSQISGKLREAKVNYFNNRTESENRYGASINGFKQLGQDYEECEMGLRRAYEGFTDRSLGTCKAYAAEARYLQSKAAWKRVAMEEQIERVAASRIIQFAFEDAVNSARSQFAKRNKTYVEAAGGPLGISGYLTVIYHYSHAAYLHLLMLVPLCWLYFDYHYVIGGYPTIREGIIGVVQIDGIFDMYNNVILSFAIPIGLTLILWVIVNLILRWRVSGAKSAPRRDAKCSTNISMSSRFAVFLFWFFTIVTEIVIVKFLIINGIRGYTRDWTQNLPLSTSVPLLVFNWIPIIVLYLCSLQFIFTIWIGIFGFVYGLIDRVANVQNWRHVISAFEHSDIKCQHSDGRLPLIAVEWSHKVMPKKKDKEESWDRKYVAFAKAWNMAIAYFYETHKISKEELQRYCFKIKGTHGSSDSTDFLSGAVEKEPDLRIPPQVKDVKMHIMHLVNNIRMSKPTSGTSVREMLPLCVVTPVGAEKILYGYEFIIHVDNTQSSFLQHLIDRDPSEWQNFKRKECLTDKARDWISRMEKDVLQGTAERKEGKKKRWIDSTEEGSRLKVKISEWASLRFQALYRTVHGFMQIPRALALMARIQEPYLSQEKAEELAHAKFSYLVGYQSYAGYYDKYKKSKQRGQEGANLSKDEIEAHESVFFIKFIRKKFPEIKIAYPEKQNGRYYGKLVSGVKQMRGTSKLDDYRVEIFGPFTDFGLGKPAHQNFLAQFIDGMIIQDNVLPQSYFIPNVLGEFAADKKVRIVGLPEYVITTKWSSTAWCSAFSEHTFGTLTQRTYARFGVRLHYGHPDFLDALWVQTETGLSKLPYVSEDIFTGFDTVLKGGKIIHVEYHEVGKARDVDLYTTTKFQRKISMGASQMSCSRYIGQMHTSWSVSVLQGLCYYYSTVGFYLNHLILYLSVWVAITSQLILIILQRYVFGEDIQYFITERVYTFQVGFALVFPGILQLILEFGLIEAAWAYLSHFFILSVYSTFHILNTSSYWQWGLTKSAFYLGSGRGTGLEHYFMKDLYATFYTTHWGPAFIIFWMGILALSFSGSFLVFLVMYLLPSGIWLWGAIFLNPGSLPSTVHEEQWKRLMNVDMQQAAQIVKEHSRIDYHPPEPPRNWFKRIFVKMWRLFTYGLRVVHWLYTLLNFAVFMRVVRFIAILALLWEWIFAQKIATFLFTDDRRRVLRWDEDDTRQKSIFFSSMVRKPASESSSQNNSPSIGKPKSSGVVDRTKTREATLRGKMAQRAMAANLAAEKNKQLLSAVSTANYYEQSPDMNSSFMEERSLGLKEATDDETDSLSFIGQPGEKSGGRQIKRNRSVRFIKEGASSTSEEDTPKGKGEVTFGTTP